MLIIRLYFVAATELDTSELKLNIRAGVPSLTFSLNMMKTVGDGTLLINVGEPEVNR